MKTPATIIEKYFSFQTVYNGNNMDLMIVPVEDKYTVLENDKPIGYIKLGESRHTWIVVDSKYIAPQLINEIANRIAASN